MRPLEASKHSVNEFIGPRKASRHSNYSAKRCSEARIAKAQMTGVR